MKKILLIITFLLFLIGCETLVSKIAIEVDDSTVPEFIYIDEEFNISDIKVKVKYSNDSEQIISLSNDMIDSQDLLKFSKVGTHIIKVLDKGLSDTFSITVKEKTKQTLLTSLTISGEKVVYVLETITLTVTATPVGAPCEVVWTSSNPDIATVNQNGQVSGIKPGFADIKAHSKTDSSIEILYRIEVLQKDPVSPNYNNYEITIMVDELYMFEHDPFSDKYSAFDKEYKIKAWEEIQDIYNVRLSVKPLPEDAPPYGPQRVNWLIGKAASNESSSDIMVVHTDWIPMLAKKAAIVDVSTYYKNIGRNSIAKGIKDSGIYNNNLYILPEVNFGKPIVNQGLYFNVNLLESLGLENPAKLFNDGLWTYSKFEEYVKDAATLLGDDMSVLSGKPVYLYMGMANASGIKLVDTVNLTVNLENEYVKEAVDILQDLYKVPKVWGSNFYDNLNTSFNEGKSIFQVAEYWYLKNPSRFPEDMWGDGSTRYGYVPFPYPDSITKEDTKINYEGSLAYVMMKGRTYPDYISEVDIYRVFSNMMISTNINIMSDPEVYEPIILQSIYEQKIDDEESRKALSYFTKEKLIFEGVTKILPIWNYSGPMIDEVVVDGKDYIAVLNDYNTKEGVIITKLIEIYG